MKRLMQVTLAAAVVAMAASPALAQQQRQRQGGGRGFGGFGGGALFLLGQKSVQEELKLSDDQVNRVRELTEKQRGSFGELRDLSPEERRAKMQEIVKATDKALSNILKPEQYKRVRQIALQRTGAAAVNDEEVAKALNITEAQKEKIREIQTKAREEMQGLGFDEEARTKRQELMKAMNEKISGVLTAEQKAKLKDMQGEPFKGEIRFGGRGR